ncbi:MAG TPA: gluconokinase [Candidatus Baltobacteraceae bacterium]|jgi:carbohydrate kinase (thermoresistant glucokinase family)|nr:gluconokinase [Candidatus Baltobacteraceae bacterium]
MKGRAIDPPVLVVMGVSGCGKSTVGALLAGRLGWAFAEGDDLHPPENIEKMSRGIALSEADRRPWLHAVAEVIDRWRSEGTAGIITCSALRRSYRDALVEGRPRLCFLYLKANREFIQRRLTQRLGHFMPATLLDSQFATLEEPGPEEPVIICSNLDDPESVAEKIIADRAFSFVRNAIL